MAGMPPALRIATSFQPVFSVHSSALAGFEALARPVNGTGEPVAPAGHFASCAPADLARLDRECRRIHLSRFADLDEGRGRLHINVHPRALVALAALDLRTEIALHGLAPARVCIEIMDDECGDEGLLAEAVSLCRATGIRVAVEGCGIARSGIERVTALAPDYVKIDRARLDESKAGRFLPAFVRALHEGRTEVIVEGIEEASQALHAIEAGADFVQGFYFGTPRPTLAVDRMATDLICRLKRLRSTCGTEPDHSAGSMAAACLGRLLAGAPAMGTAD
jgi:EAL domain-containing protein (putative c-di-GMP-specific phosphodiesterase class I)